MQTDSKDISLDAAPVKLDFSLKTTTNRLIRNRTTLFFNSDRPTYTGANNDVITINFNPNSFCDMQNSYLLFNMRPLVNGMRLNGSAARIIDRIRISCASTVLEEIVDYGTLDKILTEHTLSPLYIDTVGRVAGGDARIYSEAKAANAVGTVVLPNGTTATLPVATAIPVTAGAGVGYMSIAADRSYVLNLGLVSGLFGMREYLPCHLIGNIKIEITLNNPSRAFSRIEALYPLAAAGNAPVDDYRVSGVNLVADVLTFADDVGARIDKRLNEQGITMTFPTWFVTTTTNQGSESGTVEFKKTAFDGRSAYLLMRNTNARQNIAVDSFDSCYSRGTLTLDGVQASIGVNQYPTRKILSVAQQYVETLKAFNKLHAVNYPSASFDDYQGTKHLMGIELDKDSSSSYVGANLAGSGQYIVWNYNLSAPTNVEFTLMLYYTRVIQILPNQNVIVKD